MGSSAGQAIHVTLWWLIPNPPVPGRRGEEPEVSCKSITPVALTWITDGHPEVHHGNPVDSELPFLLKLSLTF